MPRLKAPWNERNGRFSRVKAIVFALLFAPAGWIVFQAATGMLDPKPVTEMIHRTGDWAVRLILLSLLVTPLRRFAQWPKLIAVRRMVGVAAFAYAFAHLCLYVVDQKYDLLHVAAEIALRFYLTIGFVAWLGLAALSATSTDAMIKRLGACALEPSAQARLRDRGAGDLPFLSAIEGRRFRAGADDGIVFHPDARAPVAERAAGRPGASSSARRLVAPLATALLEATWYAIVRHIDFWDVLSANFDPDMSPRPSHYVALAGLAFFVVYAARNWRLRRTSAVLAGAE